MTNREREPSEQVLRHSHARLLGIVDSAMDAIVTADGEQRIVLFNRAAETMFQCSADEALGQPLDRFIPERFRAAHASYIESFGQTGITTRTMAGARAVYGLRANGEEFPIEASISQLESEGEKFYTVILRDISERKRAEERFRLVIERAPNGMVMVDQAGNIVFANAQVERSFGYRPEELLGQSIEVLIPPRFRADHSVYRRDYSAEPTARPMGSGRHLFGLRKDGSEFPVEIGLNPIQTEQGPMVLGTIVDITERRKAEEALSRSEERFSKAFRSSANPASITRLSDGVYIDVNDSFLRAVGYSRDEVIGRSSLELGIWLEPRQRTTIVEDLHNGRPVCNRELNYASRSGEERTWLLSAELVEIEGEPCIIGIRNDITDRKRVEEELVKLNRELEMRVLDRTAQLETANKELEAFSYSVSHDLRAPLRHIHGFTDLLEKHALSSLDEKGQRYLRTISAAAIQMGRLIDDLLAFSRMGRAELQKTHVSFEALVREVQKDLREETEHRSIVWTIPSLPDVQGDPAMLRQVLANLLSNAVKYTRTRDEAHIEVGCLNGNPDELIFFVRDNGVGFDMRYVDKLFGVFQRLHRPEEFEGTGVGLATVRRIVNRHGGRAWAESQPGCGATLYFSLPRTQGESRYDRRV